MFLTSKFLLFYTIVLITIVYVSSANSINRPGQKRNEKSSKTNVRVFYHSGSNDSVPLLDDDDDDDNDNEYGLESCYCTNEKCSCCVDIRIQSLNIYDNVCVNLEVLKNGNSLTQLLLTSFELNKVTLFVSTMTILSLKAIAKDGARYLHSCIPVPFYEILSMCIKVDPIFHDGWNSRIGACANMEVRYIDSIRSNQRSIWSLRFSCVSMGIDDTQRSNSSSKYPIITGMTSTTTIPLKHKKRGAQYVDEDDDDKSENRAVKFNISA